MDLSQDSVRQDEVCPAGAAPTAATPSGPRFLTNSGSETKVAPPDRRREPRFPMAGSVRVGWVGGDHQMRYVSARGIDISEAGLGVWIEERLLAGSLVHIDLGGCGMSAVGRVRYCVPDGSGCRTGFEVINSFPSDPADISAE
jgi:hypothetical protein